MPTPRANGAIVMTQANPPEGAAGPLRVIRVGSGMSATRPVYPLTPDGMLYRRELARCANGRHVRLADLNPLLSTRDQQVLTKNTSKYALGVAL